MTSEQILPSWAVVHSHRPYWSVAHILRLFCTCRSPGGSTSANPRSCNSAHPSDSSVDTHTRHWQHSAHGIIGLCHTQSSSRHSTAQLSSAHTTKTRNLEHTRFPDLCSPPQRAAKFRLPQSPCSRLGGCNGECGHEHFSSAPSSWQSF